jgi:hypothetical protein
MQDPAGWRLRIDTGRFSQRIAVRSSGHGTVCFSAPIVAVPDPAPMSLEALTHFLLTFNARLRLVRAGLRDGHVVVEAAGRWVSPATAGPSAVEVQWFTHGTGTRL